MRLLLVVAALLSSACWVSGRLRGEKEKTHEEELLASGATPCTLQCYSDRLACGRGCGGLMCSASCDKSQRLCLDICFLRAREAAPAPSPAP